MYMYQGALDSTLVFFFLCLWSIYGHVKGPTGVLNIQEKNPVPLLYFSRLYDLKKINETYSATG